MATIGGPLGSGYKPPSSPFARPVVNPNPVSRPGGPGAGGIGGQLGRGVEGAKAFKDMMGLPSWADIMAKLEGGGSAGGGAGPTIGGLYHDKEYGNAGMAKAGAAKMAAEMAQNKAALAKQLANVNKARAAYNDPTHQQGFQNIMRLTNEQENAAVESNREAEAFAAQRRGYVGGYNPGRAEKDRLEAIAQAGYENADAERKSALGLLGAETGQYGAQQAEYSDAMKAYADLTGTSATIPTLSQSSNLQQGQNPALELYKAMLGGLGGAGDIFSTGLKGAMYENDDRRQQQAIERGARNDQAARARANHASGQW